jgi:excinuclease UvrABC ATPase subunit
MEQKFIEVIHARENNLKNVSLKIPKGKITVFTGVSGSGKSSIVFDTIAQEAGRQLNETYSNFIRNFLPKYSRPDVDELNHLSTAIVVDQKPLGGNSRSTLGTITDIQPLLRLMYSRFATPALGHANAYSFNDPAGLCQGCEGIGKTMTLNAEAAIDFKKSLNEGAILLPGYGVGSWMWKSYTESGFFDNDKKICDYSEAELENLFHKGSTKLSLEYKGSTINSSYEGIAVKFMRHLVGQDKDLSATAAKKLKQFTTQGECQSCKGTRYNENVLSSKIFGYSIADLCGMQLDELLVTLKTFEIPDGKLILDRVVKKLENLCDIGLSYMNLNRATPTLSGGESQRVKMVKYLSSDLTGLMYIFDEPSTGLHPRDVYKLNDLLLKIRDKGNTVIVVEHDPDVIQIADHVVDVGPKAGRHGGEIMYSGSYAGLLETDTLTGHYLSQKLAINMNPRPASEFLESRKSSRYNLKNVSLRVPTGIFTVVTGVAGSGKSTLVNQVFAKDYPEAIHINQSAVHTTSRSNPATFSEIMTPIRKVFAEANNVSNSLFSYNSDGACEKCKGKGSIELNMSFMDTVEVQCDDCLGTRFKTEVLEHQYKEKNMVDIMEMTVTESLEFFDGKEIKRKLASLETVGLGYLTLGQPLNTLSGGECQRLKVAKELNKKGNIYILDEPTTGLHMADVKNILAIINKLVEKGNTVIVIEHHTDVIRSADWIIDLGPDGGSGGGEVLYEGIPNGIFDCERSITANYL